MMTEPSLQLIDRNSIKYNKAKSALKDGKIPGVLYSKGNEPQPFYVNDSDLTKLLITYGTSRRVSITFNNQKSHAIIKDFQKDSLKNQFIHIDLQTLNENEKVRVSSAIHIINSEAVENDGKILQMQTNEVHIQMLPSFIPDSVTADASLLLEKDNILICDLNIASDSNIEILQDLDTVVLTLVYAQTAPVEDEQDNEQDNEQEKEPKLVEVTDQ